MRHDEADKEMPGAGGLEEKTPGKGHGEAEEKEMVQWKRRCQGGGMEKQTRRWSMVTWKIRLKGTKEEEW